MLLQVLLRAEKVPRDGAFGVAGERPLEPAGAASGPAHPQLKDHQAELAAGGLPLLSPPRPRSHRLPPPAQGAWGRHRHDSRRLAEDQRSHPTVQAGQSSFSSRRRSLQAYITKVLAINNGVAING